MSADFNAGSIEGTLDLDTAPFRAGLVRAKEEARSFQSKTIDPKVTLDRGEFEAKKALTKAELARLDHEKVTPKVDLDIAGLTAKVAMIHALLAKSLDVGGAGKALTGPAFAVGKLVTMIGLFASLAAAAGPAGAAVLGFGGAAGAAFGGAGIALGLFGAAVKSAFGELQKANKAGKQLPGIAGQAQKALKSLGAEWQHLLKSVNVFPFLKEVFNGVAGVLPKLTPLLRTTAKGMEGVAKQVFALTRAPIFDRFLKQLTTFMHGLTAGMGPVLVNLLKTFMNMFSALRPLMRLLGRGIEDITAKAAHMSAELAHGGMKPFVQYLRATLPSLGALVAGVFHGLLNIGKGLAPLAGPALHFIGALVQGIGGLNIAPLAKGFADVLRSLEPIIPVLGAVINTLSGPFGSLLSALATGPVAQIAHSLLSELRPALGSLKSILNDLVKPIADFLGSIANLANPTGISLVASLLKALKGPVHTLAPAIANLATALENVIDNGLKAIEPLIPPLGRALNKAAGFAANFANGLAGILKHKGLTDTVLGIAVGIKAVILAAKGYAALSSLATNMFKVAKATVAMTAANLSSFVGNLGAFISLARSEGIIGTLAATFPRLATGITLVGRAVKVAMGPVGWIILGLGLLVTGLIYAYNHSKTFHKIVDASFKAVKHAVSVAVHAIGASVKWVVDFIRNHWQLLLGILTGPIGAAVIFLITHFNQIKHVVSTVMDAVKNFVKSGVDNVVGWFTSLPGRIGALAGQMFNAGKSLMSAIFHGLESAATAVGGFAGNIASAIWNDLKGVLNAILPHSLSINKGPIHFSVPLFPWLAKGGVTGGPMLAGIGDNPGGKEAVVPLDKYDLPKKGENAAALQQTHADNRQIIALLGLIANHLAKGSDVEALVSSLSDVLGKHNEATMKRMVQIARAT